MKVDIYILSSRSVKNKWADISFLYFSITSLAWITLSIIQCSVTFYVLVIYCSYILKIGELWYLAWLLFLSHGMEILFADYNIFFSLPELMLFFSTLPYWDSVGSLWWKILHFKLSNLFLYVSCLIVTTWRYTSTLWKFVNWDFSRVTWGCLEHMVVGYTTTYMHSEPISTNVVSSNPTHG